MKRAIKAIANFSPRKFSVSTGFEAMASALALQYSTNWAMKNHMLEADQCIEFMIIFTRNRNETRNEIDLNCGDTDEVEVPPSQL